MFPLRVLASGGCETGIFFPLVSAEIRTEKNAKSGGRPAPLSRTGIIWYQEIHEFELERT